WATGQYANNGWVAQLLPLSIDCDILCCTSHFGHVLWNNWRTASYRSWPGGPPCLANGRGCTVITSKGKLCILTHRPRRSQQQPLRQYCSSQPAPPRPAKPTPPPTTR